MRSALLCVFFALIVHNGIRATDSDFRPIPIPLDEWNHERRAGRVGTLHEAISTDLPPAVAALPAHYWEDALRHSVYLTLVRDKIDQLIAKGVVVSPNTKKEQYVSKEVDDHDLWEKIKKAPFDRIKEDELPTFGDVTIMAKGRLMEESGGFRFTEDERSREDCSDDKCMQSVKAFWSVKRVRQRDVETSPGRYHYELTFSVNSQPPKKQKKPFENPVRTFTVRENAPDTVVGTPQEHPVYQPVRPPIPRPQRAVWFHKNIAPKHYNQGRYYNQGLDRIFSSFFSDDDTHAEPPPRYKPNPYAPPPMYPQYSKLGYVGQPTDQHQQKRLMPYPYKPHHMYKYRPPLSPPPTGPIQSHYIEHPYVHQPPPDHRYISPSNIVKTTRPAVLATPPMPNPNATAINISDETNTNRTIIIEETTKLPELPVPSVYPTTAHKTYTKPRPPMKVSYFSEHVRPPVYNAPPGVFLSMDKKPFKPMPPLKYHHHHSSKPSKKPVDFRPSPQLIDGQFSYPDTEVDSAFKPILVNHTDSESEEDIEITHSIRHGHKPPRKQASKKPPKKHENIKLQRITTTAPDIITVNNDSGEDDNMHWADVLSAFSKTTPMLSGFKPESTTKMTSSITKNDTTITTEASEEPSKTTSTTTTTTTATAIKKRTRPPPKFAKPEKVRKHKRITTTTTNAPEKSTLKKPSDLTPQASSAATNAPKSWKPKNKTTSNNATVALTTVLSVTTNKTTTTTTTEMPTTKHTPPSTTSTKPTEATIQSIEDKNKSRFRISTLMQHGTSVKHDRWSVNNTADKKSVVPAPGKYPPRRKGSNFQGYASTSKYRQNIDYHRQKFSSELESMTRSTTESVTVADTTPAPTAANFDEIPIHFNRESSSAYTQNRYEDDVDDDDDNDDNNEDIEVKGNNDDEHEIEDHQEFIFGLSSTLPNERTNEIIEDESMVTEQSLLTTTHAVAKNKTRCKKKKNHHLVPTTSAAPEDEELTTTIASLSSTKSSTGIDLLDQFLGSFTYDESTEKAATKPSQQELEEEESENHEKYLKVDEDFEEFLGNLGGRHRHPDDKDDVDYEDEESEAPTDDESPYDNEDVNENGRDASDKEYEDYRERSYSLLELMAME